jgi:hypothetical protein
MLSRHALWLTAGLTSCAVGGFSIVDELPGTGGVANSSGSAGIASGGVDTTGGMDGNGGSNAPAGGKAQGGQTTQGGSATNGGKAGASQAGEPAVSEAGAAGEGGAPAIELTKPCDLDSTGMPPLLCDDFESGTLNPQKWDPPAGIAPELMAGPHGMTKLMHLGPELPTKLQNLNIGSAGSQVTLSFWFNMKSQSGNGLNLITFRTATNPEIFLQTDIKDLHWVNSSMQRAPSVAGGSGLPPGQWFCVSIYLTSVNMNFSYVSALDPTKVVTVVVDEMPTPGVDDIWLNQSPDLRKIVSLVSFGPNPALPGDLLLDDVRVVRDKSNVCGL